MFSIFEEIFRLHTSSRVRFYQAPYTDLCKGARREIRRHFHLQRSQISFIISYGLENVSRSRMNQSVPLGFCCINIWYCRHLKGSFLCSSLNLEPKCSIKLLPLAVLALCAAVQTTTHPHTNPSRFTKIRPVVVFAQSLDFEQSFRGAASVVDDLTTVESLRSSLM